MKQYLKLTYDSLKNHGLKVVLIRLIKFIVVKFKRYFLLNDPTNQKKWEDIKGKYNGKRVFVIGNGPSLNETPLYLLKDEYKICFNHFYLMLPRVGWNPDFFMITDDMVIRDMPELFTKSLLPGVEYSFFPDIHPNNTNFKKYVPNRDNVLWMHNDYPGFRLDLPKCGINRTVVNAAIQVMAHLGFSEIILLGVDVSYSFQSHKVKNISTRDLVSEEDDPNHFDPRYFGIGKKYHYQPMYEMVERFQVVKEFFDKQNVKIINAGVGGKLEVFERKTLSSILNYGFDKEKEIFENLVNNYLQNFKFEFKYEEIIQTIDNLDLEKDYFVIEQNIGKDMIAKLIYSHIALGPFNECYVFIKNSK